jgi:hypothetical protein
LLTFAGDRKIIFFGINGFPSRPKQALSFPCWDIRAWVFTTSAWEELLTVMVMKGPAEKEPRVIWRQHVQDFEIPAWHEFLLFFGRWPGCEVKSQARGMLAKQLKEFQPSVLSHKRENFGYSFKKLLTASSSIKSLVPLF